MADTVEINGKKFTQVGTSRYKQVVYGPNIPPCQKHFIHGGLVCPKPGEFDSPTPSGPWADLCEEHAALLASKNSSAGYHRLAE